MQTDKTRYSKYDIHHPVGSCGWVVIYSRDTGGAVSEEAEGESSKDACCSNPEGKLQIFCNVMPDKWHAMGVMLTARGALRWLKDALCEDMERTAYESGTIFERMDMNASHVPVGSEGLFFLPYLNGERCPHNDPDVRGAFIGLHLRHRKAHFIRSVLEGVAFGLRDLSEVITELGMVSERIFASGGGANSSLWRQIMADILNQDVYTMNTAA
jgi:xylulokinase